MCFHLKNTGKMETHKWLNKKDKQQVLHSECFFPASLTFPLQKTALCSRKWRGGHVLIKNLHPAPLSSTPLPLPTSCRLPWPSFIMSHLQLFLNLSIRSGWIKVLRMEGCFCLLCKWKAAVSAAANPSVMDLPPSQAGISWSAGKHRKLSITFGQCSNYTLGG